MVQPLQPSSNSSGFMGNMKIVTATQSQDRIPRRGEEILHACAQHCAQHTGGTLQTCATGLSVTWADLVTQSLWTLSNQPTDQPAITRATPEALLRDVTALMEHTVCVRLRTSILIHMSFISWSWRWDIKDALLLLPLTVHLSQRVFIASTPISHYVFCHPLRT